MARHRQGDNEPMDIEISPTEVMRCASVIDTVVAGLGSKMAVDAWVDQPR